MQITTTIDGFTWTFKTRSEHRFVLFQDVNYKLQILYRTDDRLRMSEKVRKLGYHDKFVMDQAQGTVVSGRYFDYR